VLEGACDCHTHVIGPAGAYPMVAQRHYTPGPAPVDALRSHLSALGFQRVVVVQPSVYGTDNRCLIDTLAGMGGAARGVAVLPDDVGDAALEALHAHGVRGVRVNLESESERDPDAARAQVLHWTRRVAGLGWHVQLYVARTVIEVMTDLLANSVAPVVLDHFALPGQPPGEVVRDTRLTDLLATGRVHLKLSAPYRLPHDSIANAWAELLIRSVPAALLWGSDWPHTARDPGAAPHQISSYRSIPSSSLHAQIERWMPTPELLQRILVDNPAALYGF